MPVTYEVLEGVVQQQSPSDNGFRILDRWVNYDLRAVVRHPKPGERVKLRIRNGKYIIHLVNPDQELPPEPAPTGGRGNFRSPEEERRIVRQACLKAAITWTASFVGKLPADPSTKDVLAVAERFEQWVYR